jgi:hypothetical protein
MRLRNKVLNAQYSLRGAQSVAEGYKTHCEALKRIGVNGVDESTFLQIEIFSAKISGHINSTERLLAQINGISKMVSTLQQSPVKLADHRFQGLRNFGA